MVKRHIFLFILLLQAPFSALAVTQVDATVDKNPVMNGEYFVLTVTANDNLDAGALNTSALQRDFIIGRTSVGRSTQIINFDTSKTTTWQILLAAKHVGQFTIPPFTIDGVSSAPINLKVVAASSPQGQSKTLFMTSSLSTEQAYPGQLVLYQVKLYLGADLQRGVLNAPTINHAQIKQLGEDKDTQEIVNGKRYRVIERTYSIIPDKPGELKISPATFQGDVVISGQGGRDMFGFGMSDSRMVQSASKSHLIEVLPKPAHYQGQWLVADLVSLHDIWGDEQSYQVGNPITRTITMLASNAEDTALADMTIPEPAGFKIYPEKPQRENIVRNGQLIAKLTQTIAMVPTHAGTFTLPEVKIPWWNPQLKKQEYAKLPAKTIKVNPAPASTAAPQMPIVTTADAAQPQPQTQTIIHAGYWPWVAAGFALLWLITLLLWRRAVVSARHQLTGKLQQHQPSTANSDKLLVEACNSAMPGRVLMALQQYFSQRCNDNMTLDKISALSPEMKTLVDTLQQANYSRDPGTVDYSAIPAKVTACQLKRTAVKQHELSPLNPD